MKSILSAVVGATLALSAIEADAQATPGERQVSLTIESTSLATALDKWAQQSGFQIFVQDWEGAKNLPARSLKGTFTAQDALEQLLAGTSLTYVWISDKAVSIRKKTAQTVPTALQRMGLDGQQAIPVAKFSGDGVGVGGPSANYSSSEENGNGPRSAKSHRDEVEEIFVTGTHIRGVTPDASPLVVYDREAIERSGVATTAELMRKIPQNLARLDGETYLNNGTGGSINSTRGATVDLRGLGPGSTLILLNGHRLSPAGADGSFVDVSMIPASALQKVEVLADGGSALYGADGVAGVVNFVLRRDFEGAETNVRYGDTTHGGADDVTASQLIGGSWGSGNAFANYEFNQQGVLGASQRSFIPDQGGRFDILPSQKRNSIVLSARQQLSDQTEASAHVLFTDRRFDQTFVVFNPFFEKDAGTARNMTAMLSVAHDYSSGWRTEVTGTSSRVKERRSGFFSDGIDAFPFNEGGNSNVYSLEVDNDGALFALPGGVVRASLGLAARREGFDNLIDPSFDRDVISGYGELFIPIIGEANQHVAARRFELSLATRYDHYDDVQSSINPRIGMLWSPINGVNLRGTYSTAYRVPPLAQLASTHDYQIYPFDDPNSVNGTTITLYPSSAPNAELEPEESRSYTAGIDWKPPGIAALSVSATYFNIQYRDRILRPGQGIDILQLYNRRDVFGSFIDESPDAAEVHRILTEENVTDFSGGATEDQIAAFADLRLHNIAVMKSAGFDLSASYALDLSVGTFEAFLSSTYLSDLKLRTISTSPYVDTLNTPYQPIDFRSRAGVTWHRGGLESTLTVNYTDGYENTLVEPNGSVASWATADWQLGYRNVGSAAGWLRGLTVILDVQNVLDRAPPKLQSNPAFLDLGFDSVNASPRGRFLAISVRKQW